MKRNSQSGVALVITLILLSVITFMAITFLVISRSGAKSTKTLIDASLSKMAADDAVQQAMAQITSRMLALTNGYNFGLVVSTNIDQPFIAPNTASIGNVSYFDTQGSNLTGSALLQNLANLQVLPRPPVFVPQLDANNRPYMDFRYYLDLNRNGRFDPTGFITYQPVGSQVQLSTYVTGDPQWIGILEHPDRPYSSSNQFVARYCFIALPIGNSLDVNNIYNQSKRIKPSPNSIFDGGYIRNENVGTWELNLAGFLANLNTNTWNPYNSPPNVYNFMYNNLGIGSSGYAFDDAAAIVQAKYNNNYNVANSLSAMYQGAGLFGSITNDIDAYGSGLAFNGFFAPVPQRNPINIPWSGSDNPNAIFTPEDLFNAVPQTTPASSFSNRLYLAGLQLAPGVPLPPYNPTITQPDPYNQYTFYRLLQSMSFDSAPESTRNVAFPLAERFTGTNVVISTTPVTAAPLNLNFVNVDGISETNFIPWAATNAAMFFTNAADRLIRQAFPNPVVYVANGVTNIVPLCVTNIPVYPVNFYTPAMHRLLQLAANIYDATTTRIDNGLPYPSVFRPVFSRNGTNIFISGYVEELKGWKSYGSVPFSLPNDLAAAGAQIPVFPLTSPGDPTAGVAVNLYSAPWVIGAKKGFPNFNQFAMKSVVQMTRKLEINKVSAGTPRSGWQTNQMYIIGISNLLGVASWNSYMTNYPRGVQLIGVDYLTMTLTNDQGIRVTEVLNNGQLNWLYNILPNQWQGFKDPTHPLTGASRNAASFFIPFQTNVFFLPDSIWRSATATLVPANTNIANVFEKTGTFPLPRFGLNITNHLRYIMLDTATRRVIDYVQLDGIDSVQDLLAESSSVSQPGLFQNTGAVDSMWNTNRPGNTTAIATPTTGIINQLNVSQGVPSLSSQDWFNSQAPGANSQSEITKFQNFINGHATNRNLIAQAPYSPTRKMTFTFMLQANDPLVHYTTSDLAMTNFFSQVQPILGGTISLSDTNSGVTFGGLSTLYAPWLSFRSGSNPNDLNLAVKDPMVRCSDDWEFPNAPFPNVGWIGRVHRGTPWQTVYLKSPVAPLANWMAYTGQTNPAIAVMTHPMNDWKILDLFTTALNDNATRGQLSINNTNEAAWHAVLDGLNVITNAALTNYGSLVLDPNAHAAALSYIIQGINAARTNFPAFIGTNGLVLNYGTGSFTSLGQILAVPQLTVQSPFLNTNTAGPGLFSSAVPVNTYNSSPLLSDAAYERIPQQILSLLRVGSPRYVIFGYGQSLKPADHSVYQGGGPYFGMVTNYAITGEAVTRVVVDFPNQIPPPAPPPVLYTYAPPAWPLNLYPIPQQTPQVTFYPLPPTTTYTPNYLGIQVLGFAPQPKAMVRGYSPVRPE